MRRLILLIIIYLTFYPICAQGQTIDGFTPAQYCQAIYWAEGGAKTRHPYGILAHYRHTSPKMACIHTVSHVSRNWLNIGHPGAFLAYLGRIYAPLKASNDPTGLNRNWIHNVSWFLRHPKGGL